MISDHVVTNVENEQQKNLVKMLFHHYIQIVLATFLECTVV